MSNQQENSRSSSSSSSPRTDDRKTVAANQSLPLVAPTPSRCCLRCLHPATMLREGEYFCHHCNRSAIISRNDNIRRLTSHEHVVGPSAGLTPVSNTAHDQKSGNAPTNVASTPNVVDATSICGRCNGKVTITSGNNCFCPECNCAVLVIGEAEEPSGSAFPQAMASGEHEDEFYCGGCEEWRWIETLSEDRTCRYCNRRISNSLTQLEARFEQWEADMRANPDDDSDEEFDDELSGLDWKDQRAEARRDAQIAEDKGEDGGDEGELDDDISGADLVQFGQD